jgi:hypothetical protein
MIENIDIILTVLILLAYLICFLGIIFYASGIPVRVSVCCDRSTDIEAQCEDRKDEENICFSRNKNRMYGSLVWTATAFAIVKGTLIFGTGENPSRSRRSQLLAEANLNKANEQREVRASVVSEPESTYSVNLFQQINIDLV